MVEILNVDAETNISNPNGLRNKTKAEILYDLTLASVSSGADKSQVIQKASAIYTELRQAGIVYEVN